MPVRPVKRMGKDGHYRVIGFMWGHHGKLYTIRRWGKAGAMEKARNQGIAVKISQTRRMAVRKFYHGTNSLHVPLIEREGLKPAKDTLHKKTTSPKTDPEYVHLFEKPGLAKMYAELETQRMGLGQPVVYETELDDETLGHDWELAHAFRTKKTIPPSKLKKIDVSKIKWE